MALVHDDDLAGIDGLGDDTVSGDLYCTPVTSIFSCLQEALEPDAVLRYLQSYAGKPKIHDVPLGTGSLFFTISRPRLYLTSLEFTRKISFLVTVPQMPMSKPQE